MQSEGKIRHIGVSNFTVPQLTEAPRHRERRLGAEPLQPRRSRVGGGARRNARHSASRSCRGRRSAAVDRMPPRRSRMSRIGMGQRPNQIAIAALLAHSPMMLPIPGTSRVCASRGKHCGGRHRAHAAGSQGAVAHRPEISASPHASSLFAASRARYLPRRAGRPARSSRPARDICAPPGSARRAAGRCTPARRTRPPCR